MDDENIRITENDLPQEFILKLLGQYEARGLWGIKHTREPVDIMVKYAKTHELSLPIVQMIVTKEGIFMSPIQCRLDTQKEEKGVRRVDTDVKSRFIADKRFINTKVQPKEAWNEEAKVVPGSKPCIAQNLLKLMKENEKDSIKEQKKIFGEDRFHFCINRKLTEKKSLGTPTDLALLEKYSKIDWRKNGVFFFGIDTISYGVQDLIFTRVFSMIVVNDPKKRITGTGPFMCHAFVCESRNTARKVTYSLAAAFQAYGRSMKTIATPEQPLKRCYEERPKRVMIELRPPSEVAFDETEA